MAERHKQGHVKGEPNNPICGCDNGNTYFNCGSGCECCDSVTSPNGNNLRPSLYHQSRTTQRKRYTKILAINRNIYNL